MSAFPRVRLARIPVLAVDFGLRLPPAASSSYIKCVYAVIYIYVRICVRLYICIILLRSVFPVGCGKSLGNAWRPGMVKSTVRASFMLPQHK